MRSSPIQVGTGFYRGLTVGNNATSAIDPYGTLTAWGENLYGQAGTNSITSYSWTQLSNGDTHSLALRSDGTIWAWGFNSSGQLGTSDTIQRQSPTQVSGSWTLVKAGASHSMATKADYSVYSWGNNSNGQLGLNDILNRSSPVQVGAYSSLTNANAYSVLLNGTNQYVTTSAQTSATYLGTDDFTIETWVKMTSYSPTQTGGATYSLFFIRSSNQYLSLDNNSSMNIGTSDFTIEGWIRSSSLTSNGNAIISAANASGNTFGLAILNGSTGLWQLSVGDGTNWAFASVTFWTDVPNTWKHFAISRTGGTLYAYVDGSLVYSIANATNIPTNYFQIGSQTRNNRYFDGYMSNIRVVIGTGLYSGASMTPSTKPLTAVTNTVLLVGQNPTIIDNSGLSQTITNNGTVTTSSSVVPTTITDYPSIISVTDNWEWGYDSTVGFNFITGLLINNNVNTGVLILDNWYHIAVQRISGTISAWVNGVNTGTNSTDTTNFNSINPIYIGRNRLSSFLAYFPGYISNLRIIKGQGLFSGTFTPSVNPLTNSTVGHTGAGAAGSLTGTVVLLTCQNQSSIVDNSATGFTFTLTNSPTVGSISTPFTNAIPASAIFFSSLSAGNNFSLAIKESDKSLWTWGFNTSYQLGNGATAARSQPVQIGTSSWSQISAGNTHALAIDINSKLYGWGTQTSGQLGLGDTLFRSEPTQIGNSSWSQISAGYSHSLAITSDNKLFTWGNNLNGQLGYNLSAITIATGLSVTSVVRSDGTLWTWGLGTSGQLGDSTIVTKSSPVAVGLLKTWSNVTRPSLTNYAIDNTGKLYAWGENTTGSLGDGTTVNKSSPVLIGNSSWTIIATGGTTTAGTQAAYAIRSDGALFTWGNNLYGQLGTNNQIINISSPVQLGTRSWSVVSGGGQFAMAITSDGKLFGWGRNDVGQIGTASTFTWSKISSSGLHTLAIRSDNRLFAWGDNTGGKLGINDTISRSSPVLVSTGSYTQISAGLSNSYAIKSDGSLWAWGDNTQGQIPSIAQSRSSPVQVGTGTVYSVSFNSAVNDALTIQHNSALDLTSGDFTIECWAFPTTAPGNNAYLFNKSGIATTNYPAYSILYSTLATSWQFNTGDSTGGVNTTTYNFGGGALTGSWNHFAVVRSGTTITTYLNGVQGSSTTQGQAIVDSGQVLTIGNQINGSGGFNGNISNLRIIKGQALFSGTFTPSTSPLTTTTVGATGAGAATTLTGTVSLLTCQNDSLLDNSSNNFFVFQQLLARTTFLEVPFAVQTTTYNSWSLVSASKQSNYVLATRSDSTLYGWGNNFQGTLGSFSLQSYSYSVVTSPIQVTGGGSWTQISAGGSHTIALKSDSKLYAWGLNSTGQATTIVSPYSWTKVSTGRSYFQAIRNDGVLFFSGIQIYANGIPFDVVTRSSPVQVGTDTWSDTGAGSSFTAGIKSNGTLWTWGFNSNGQLGQNNITTYNSPVQVAGSWSVLSVAGASMAAIKNDGTLWAWGYNFYSQLGDNRTISKSSPVQITGPASWSQITIGQSFSAGIGNTGSLWVWGTNANGALGNNDIISRSAPIQLGSSSWMMVACAYNAMAAITSDGKLFTWGANNNGDLGGQLPTTTARSSPVQVGASSWTFIAGGSNQTAAGQFFGITSTGNLFSWGANDTGQLGTNDTINRSSPVQIGVGLTWARVALNPGNAVAAITTAGSLYAWGATRTDGTTVNKSSPVLVNGLTVNMNYINSPSLIGTSSWTQLAAGLSHSAAIRTDSGLFTWGLNANGQLGLTNVAAAGDTINRSSPIQLGTSSWTSVSAGSNYTMALRLGGSLFTWGLNTSGQLGLNIGATLARSSPIQVGTSSWSQINSGASAAVAISFNDNIYAWGIGSSGQLAGSTTIQRSSPTQVGTTSSTIEYSPIQVGSNSWGIVSAGSSHTLAIINEVGLLNRLYVWGLNSSGQLGQSDTVSRSSPTQVLASAGSWTKVSAGDTHSLAIRIDNTLLAWGLNSSGQLGLNDISSRSSPVQVGISNSWNIVSAGYNNSIALTTGNNSLWGWGLNTSGQLGLVDAISRSSPTQINTISLPNTSSPVQVSASSYSQVNAGNNTSTGISTDNKLFLWGLNTNGQLGINLVTSRSSPIQLGTTSYNIVSAGGSHTTFISNTSPRTIFSSGLNTSGQLGDTTTTSKSSPITIAASTSSFNSPVTVSTGEYSSYYVSSPTQIGTSSWTTVSAGGTHTLGIEYDNTLYAWGLNNYGQLADSTTINRSSPIQIGTSSWSQVSAGDSHNTVVKIDATINSFGLNNFGQLGDGT